jgi:hypothetical protein
MFRHPAYMLGVITQLLCSRFIAQDMDNFNLLKPNGYVTHQQV